MGFHTAGYGWHGSQWVRSTEAATVYVIEVCNAVPISTDIMILAKPKSEEKN